MKESSWTSQELSPFGLLISAAAPEADLRTLPVGLLRDLIGQHLVLVLRGFAPLGDDALPGYCRRFGEILEWEFGAVNELRVKEDAKNYLYTNRAVPFHWDGAFVGRVPSYIFFYCQQATRPESGGETLFCNTYRLIELAGHAQLERWQQISITYSTEKVVHYGGSFRSPLLTKHPHNGRTVLRYAEPVEDLNPVHLAIEGVATEEQPRFLADMHARLNDARCCYAHEWVSGDVVFADNHALLHGRRAFAHSARRHLRRINIL